MLHRRHELDISSRAPAARSSIRVCKRAPPSLAPDARSGRATVVSADADVTPAMPGRCASVGRPRDLALGPRPERASDAWTRGRPLRRSGRDARPVQSLSVPVGALVVRSGRRLAAGDGLPVRTRGLPGTARARTVPGCPGRAAPAPTSRPASGAGVATDRATQLLPGAVAGHRDTVCPRRSSSEQAAAMRSSRTPGAPGRRLSRLAHGYSESPDGRPAGRNHQASRQRVGRMPLRLQQPVARGASAMATQPRWLG